MDVPLVGLALSAASVIVTTNRALQSMETLIDETIEKIGSIPIDKITRNKGVFDTIRYETHSNRLLIATLCVAVYCPHCCWIHYTLGVVVL